MDSLNNDLILYIYDILHLSDKYNFIIINKNIYYLLRNDYQKHILIKLLNNKYDNYYYLLNNNNYDLKFINLLFEKAITNIITVWSNNGTMGYYDLRYIFELMFLESNVNIDILYKNKHFYEHFYFKIKNCIVNNDRKKTLNNINSGKYGLTSLQNNFQFFKKGHLTSWIPLIN